MKLLPAAAALGILLLCPDLAFACSCVGRTSVCGGLAMAEAVFVGTVTHVDNEVAKDDDGREVIVGQVARVQVDEAFKGAKAAELIFRSYGSSCDVEYKEGQRWLFYANYGKEEKAWAIPACGRSRQVEFAGDDLLYLRGLPGSAQKTRLSGQLRDGDDKPLMGVRVKIAGERQTYEAFTDKNGVYEIYDLPAGKYVVQPETPLNLKLWFASATGFPDRNDRSGLKVELVEKSCAGVDFFYKESTLVSGRVFGADGSPMRKVCVRLWLKDKRDETAFLLNCTKDDGRFEITDIGLGEYYLVANDDGVISSDEPFPLTYYPGVFEKEKATVLTIASGDKLRDLDIHIPSQRPTRTIQGRVLFSDGRPVADESVEFTSDGNGENQDQVLATTDAEGRFKLSVLEGSKGTLHGYMYGFSRDSANCPKLDKLVKAYKDITTNTIKLEMTRDHANIELVFAFPFCPKAKEKQD